MIEDDKDYLILNILQEEQGFKPISTYEIRNILKEQYNLEISQFTIHNRIKRLESKEIILNYTINFRPKKVGFRGKYIVRIKPKDPSKYDELAKKLEEKNELTDLFRIGNNMDYLRLFE
jgi:Lrp/AsnC family leucine-responsive transcriptional regulator